MLGVGVGTLDSGLLERILFPHRVYVMGCLPNMCNTSVCLMLGWEDCISTLTPPPLVYLLYCVSIFTFTFSGEVTKSWGIKELPQSDVAHL